MNTNEMIANIKETKINQMGDQERKTKGAGKSFETHIGNVMCVLIPVTGSTTKRKDTHRANFELDGKRISRAKLDKALSE